MGLKYEPASVTTTHFCEVVVLRTLLAEIATRTLNPTALDTPGQVRSIPPPAYTHSLTHTHTHTHTHTARDTPGQVRSIPPPAHTHTQPHTHTHTLTLTLTHSHAHTHTHTLNPTARDTPGQVTFWKQPPCF